MKRPPLPARTKPIARGKRPRARNPKRCATTFERAYGSVDRVEWVKAQPSVVSGKRPCENAHIEGDGGSHKADFTKIVPLTFHEHRVELHASRAAFEAKYGIDLDVAAAQTDARYEASRREVAW